MFENRQYDGKKLGLFKCKIWSKKTKKEEENKQNDLNCWC